MIGRQTIYAFFGGPNEPEPPMHMGRHHLAFDEEQQMGGWRRIGTMVSQLETAKGILPLEVWRYERVLEP